MVLHPAQLAVGMRSRTSYARRHQAVHFGARQQSDIPRIVDQGRMVGRLRQHQKLHRKLGVHHSPGAVFDIELVRLDRMGAADLVAHRHNFCT